VDLDTLKKLDFFHLDIGIYSMNFDTKRRMLLAASHFVGRILAYDVDRQVVAGSLFLGKRVRWIDVDDQNGKWCVTSSVGGFGIDPEEFMKQLN